MIVQWSEEGKVERTVWLHDRLAAPRVGGHLFHQRVQRVQIGRSDAVRHCANQAGFESLTELEEILKGLAVDKEAIRQVVQDRFEGEGLDEDSFAMARFEDAKRREALSRLTERETAHAQLVRER